MNRMILKSQVGTDGVLHVDVAVGISEAGRNVQITIDPENVPPSPHQDYQRFLDETAGAWQGDFVRPDQGAFEDGTHSDEVHSNA
jgi:hypothetical protein